MNERLVISSPNHIVELGSTNPSIFNVGGLSVFRGFKRAVDKPSCPKCTTQAARLAEMRPQLESALATLVGPEQARLKTMLNVKKICFYRKSVQGQLSLHCF